MHKQLIESLNMTARIIRCGACTHSVQPAFAKGIRSDTCKPVWWAQAAVDWANAPSTASDDQRTIVLTVLDDQDLVKSVREVGQMPFTAFAALYSVSSQPFAIDAASLHECMFKLACTFLDRRSGCKSSA